MTYIAIYNNYFLRLLEPEPEEPTKAQTNETGCQTDKVIVSCIEKMENMFNDILESSDLDSEEKVKKKEQYSKYLQELRNSL